MSEAGPTKPDQCELDDRVLVSSAASALPAQPSMALTGAGGRDRRLARLETADDNSFDPACYAVRDAPPRLETRSQESSAHDLQFGNPGFATGHLVSINSVDRFGTV
eukprot:6172994-Pleurochrysis_carterae.AAC.3